jgi:hypothetical protein
VATFGKQQTQVETIPYRHFSQGFYAGVACPVSKGEIEDIVRILSTLPVDEWLSSETLEYSVGLLARWLPSLATPAHLQYLQLPSASVPDTQES